VCKNRLQILYRLWKKWNNVRSPGWDFFDSHCRINSLFHSVNLIVFTLLLVHLILRISPHHSHHHLSLPPPFTPDLKLISFTNPFLHSRSYSFRTDFTDLNLYRTKWALAFVCFSFLFYIILCFLSWSHSAFQSMPNSSIVSYRIADDLYHGDCCMRWLAYVNWPRGQNLFFTTLELSLA